MSSIIKYTASNINTFERLKTKNARFQAHTVQTKLIQAEMSGSGNKPEVGLLMVHAQDHYMTSQLARDLIEELINVFEAKEGK